MYSGSRGFSTVEMLIAIVIFTSLTAGAVLMYQSIMRQKVYADAAVRLDSILDVYRAESPVIGGRAFVYPGQVGPVTDIGFTTDGYYVLIPDEDHGYTDCDTAGGERPVACWTQIFGSGEDGFFAAFRVESAPGHCNGVSSILRTRPGTVRVFGSASNREVRTRDMRCLEGDTQIYYYPQGDV